MKEFRVMLSAAGLAAMIALTGCGGGSNSSDNTSESPAPTATTSEHAGTMSNGSLDKQNDKSATILKINMGAQNGSKQSGSAQITDNPGGGVTVDIALSGEPTGVSEPAHIHKGTCAKLDPVPFKALAPVSGKSRTTLADISVAQLKAGHYAINVHDAKNLKHYVSCGDL